MSNCTCSLGSPPLNHDQALMWILSHCHRGIVASIHKLHFMPPILQRFCDTFFLTPIWSNKQRWMWSSNPWHQVNLFTPTSLFSNWTWQMLSIGCSNNPMNYFFKSQNLINIYVFPFKTMGNYCFFVHWNVKEFKPKIHLMKFLILSFDLGPWKMYKNVSNNSQFCKGLSKGLI
jgi:hypothetical protein